LTHNPLAARRLSKRKIAAKIDFIEQMLDHSVPCPEHPTTQ
jgi:hypothetical protein